MLSSICKSTSFFLLIGSTSLLPYSLLRVNSNSDNLPIFVKKDLNKEFYIKNNQIIKDLKVINQIENQNTKFNNNSSERELPVARGNVYIWLSTLGFKSEDIYRNTPLTIIVKWDNWAFRILQLDRECNCFKQLNLDTGIWVNSLGSFTISESGSHIKAINGLLKEQCTNFSSFWYQEWHTWWRLKSWIRDFNERGSCYKYPLVVLETETTVPYFGKNIDFKLKESEKSKIGTSRHIYWDDDLQRFSGSLYNQQGMKNMQINNYENYSKLFSLLKN